MGVGDWRGGCPERNEKKDEDDEETEYGEGEREVEKKEDMEVRE